VFCVLCFVFCVLCFVFCVLCSPFTSTIPIFSHFLSHPPSFAQKKRNCSSHILYSPQFDIWLSQNKKLNSYPFLRSSSIILRLQVFSIFSFFFLFSLFLFSFFLFSFFSFFLFLFSFFFFSLSFFLFLFLSHSLLKLTITTTIAPTIRNHSFSTTTH
jgi:hypothetical protein